jgi:hypothetical protein
MTPDQLAKSGTEHSQQRALFAWANMAQRFGFAAAWDDLSYTTQGHAATTYGGVPFGKTEAQGLFPVPVLARLHAIPNGGYRDKITAGKLKAEGVKQGVPDVFLPLPCPSAISGNIRYCGLYIELKRPKTGTQRKGTTSAEQDDWIAYLRQAGYAVSVVFDWREAARTIEHYIREAGAA